MTTGIIPIIKQAAMNAVENAQMCDLRYGTVTSVSPLKVQITNQFIIPASLFVVPQHLTNYEVECTISQPAQTISGTTEKSTSLKDEDEPLSEHTHEFSVTTNGGKSKQTITVYNALKIGDKVALLRKQGGQSYFILDRI